MIEIRRVVDRSAQDQVRALETEYFTWVNAQLGTEFGIGLDVEAMIAADLADLEVYFPPHGALLVAEEDGELAGMVFLAPVAAGTAQVRRMYVRPAHRRRGLGGALFGAVVTAGRQSGCTRLVLESPRSWAGAHAVYTAHGFTPVSAHPASEVPEHLRAYWTHMELEL